MQLNKSSSIKILEDDIDLITLSQTLKSYIMAQTPQTQQRQDHYCILDPHLYHATKHKSFIMKL